MVIAELVLSFLLFIGALLHAYGSFLTFAWGSPELVWSLGSSGFAVLLALLCGLRARRQSDRALSVLAAIGCAGWTAIVLSFGISIGNPADPRVLYHVVVTLLLFAFATRGFSAGAKS